MSDYSAESYSLLCDLFERFGHGYFNTEDDPEDWVLLTSPQARAFALRAIEILQQDDTNVWS